jgi:hypothetical protein
VEARADPQCSATVHTCPTPRAVPHLGLWLTLIDPCSDKEGDKEGGENSPKNDEEDDVSNRVTLTLPVAAGCIQHQCWRG